MKKTSVIILVLTFSTALFAQLSKEQIYAMTDANLGINTIVSMIRTNCVQFRLDGDLVVELSQRVPADVLRAIVDCQREADQIAAQEEKAAAEAEAAAIESPPQGMSQAPAFVTAKVEANRSSMLLTGMEFRLVPLGMETTEVAVRDQATLRYQFFGEAKSDEEIRLIKASQLSEMSHQNYVGYLVLNSSRKKGFRGRRDTNSDVVRFMVSLEGDGPIYFEVITTEPKFNGKKEVQVKAIGPLTIHNQRHLTISGLTEGKDLSSLFL